jgi:hypothetical protein
MEMGVARKRWTYKKGKGIVQYIGRKFKRCDIMEYLSMTENSFGDAAE